MHRPYLNRSSCTSWLIIVIWCVWLVLKLAGITRKTSFDLLPPLVLISNKYKMLLLLHNQVFHVLQIIVTETGNGNVVLSSTAGALLLGLYPQLKIAQAFRKEIAFLVFPFSPLHYALQHAKLVCVEPLLQ